MVRSFVEGTSPREAARGLGAHHCIRSAVAGGWQVCGSPACSRSSSRTSAGTCPRPLRQASRSCAFVFSCVYFRYIALTCHPQKCPRSFLRARWSPRSMGGRSLGFSKRQKTDRSGGQAGGQAGGGAAGRAGISRLHEARPANARIDLRILGFRGGFLPFQVVSPRTFWSRGEHRGGSRGTALLGATWGRRAARPLGRRD